MAWRKPANLREWLQIIFRHKKKFFFPAVAVAIVVVLASFKIPREYRAEAIFERAIESTFNDQGAAASRALADPIRRAVRQDLISRPTIEQLIDDLHLGRLPANPDGTLTTAGQLKKQELVRQIQGKIEISYQLQSDQRDRIVVAYADSNRELAPRIVNRLVKNYIDKTTAQLNEKLVSAKAFFERERDRLQARVADLEQRKLRHEMQHPGLAPNDPASVQDKLVDIRARHQRAEEELATAIERRKEIQSLYETMPEMIERKQRTANPALVDLQSRRGEIERELEEHLLRFGRTEEHPLVIKTRRRIAEIDAAIANTTAEVEGVASTEPNTARFATAQELRSLTGTINALERRRDELRGQLEQYEVLNQSFFVIRNEYQRLSRELSEAASQLEFWENNLRRTTIALTQEVGQHGVRMSIFQNAPDLAKPSKPTLLGIIAAAAALGLGAGVVMVILAELLDHTFHSIEQAVDDLKLPVLGTVNEIVTPGEMFRRKLMGWCVYPSVGAVMVLVLVAVYTVAYMSLEQPQSYELLRYQPGQYIKQTLFG